MTTSSPSDQRKRDQALVKDAQTLMRQALLLVDSDTLANAAREARAMIPHAETAAGEAALKEIAGAYIAALDVRAEVYAREARASRMRAEKVNDG